MYCKSSKVKVTYDDFSNNTWYCFLRLLTDCLILIKICFKNTTQQKYNLTKSFFDSIVFDHDIICC